MMHQAYEHWKTTPLSDIPELSVVIPAYNEAERIVPLIDSIASYVCSTGISWELIIADDCSTDGTPDLCAGLGLANLRVLRAQKSGGKGSAVRRGMLFAKGYYVLFSDIDSSTPIEELAQLLDVLERSTYDIAVGSRAVNGRAEAVSSPFHRLLSMGLCSLVRYGLRIGVHDTQCGFKLFTRAAAQRLYAAQTRMGFSFDLEILFLAHRLGYRIAEVPVACASTARAKVDPMEQAYSFLSDLLAIKLNDLRGVYPKA